LEFSIYGTGNSKVNTQRQKGENELSRIKLETSLISINVVDHDESSAGDILIHA
jgi:hypothetical protein